MSAWPRRLRFALLAAALVVLARPVSAAWVETHVTADEVRVEVATDGSALVEHTVVLKVQGGPLKGFDLSGIDRDAAPVSDATVVMAQADGSTATPLPVALDVRPDGALHVGIDPPRGIGHGAWVLHVRYRTNLAQGLERDGAMLRLRWTGPSWVEGLDGAKCTFVLPAAPTAPRVGADRGTPDDGVGGAFLVQVRRMADHDEIELVRPHVARGERVAWSTRVDPRAFPDVRDPRLAPPAPVAALDPAPLVDVREIPGWLGLAAGALVAAYAALLLAKASQVARAAARVGAASRPLVAAPAAVRALLGGVALAAFVVLEQLGLDARVAVGFALAAMLLAWYRAPRVRQAPRGPGRWMPVADGEAFAPGPAPEGAWLDAGTRLGALVALLAALVATAAATALAQVEPGRAWLVALVALVLVPTFGTGRLADLPPDPAHAPASRLRRIARAMRTSSALRTLAWGRVPLGSDTFDELRLLVAPRVPRRGFVGIEIGFAWADGAGGYIGLPEVLVRVVDGSPCHEAFAALLGGVRWTRGRRADERVAAIVPRLPTVGFTTALARRLAEHACDPAPARAARPKPSPARASTKLAAAVAAAG